MARRKGWRALSAPVRRRYERAGITATSYRQGASLDRARGHYTPRNQNYVHPPKGPRPPKAALEKLVAGVANTQERRAVERWYENDAPAWLRSRNLSADTAAQIFNANLRPENYGAIDVYRQRDGTAIVYVESKRGGPRRKIVLPDVDAANEFIDYVEESGFEGDSEMHGIDCSTKASDRNYTPKGRGK